MSSRPEAAPARIPEPWRKARSQKAALERRIAGEAGSTVSSGFLFIYGCPRSGTTATAELLNEDPRIAMGLERFKYIDGCLRPFHFEPDYFLNPTPDETNILRPKLYERLERKFADGAVRMVGDKLQARDGAAELRRVASEFDPTRFLFVLRDVEPVAESFNRRAGDPADRRWPETYDARHAVKRWNGSLRALRRYVEDGGAAPVHVLVYEEFYAGNRDRLLALYSFLGMDVPPEVERAYEGMVRGWDRRQARAPELSPEDRAVLEESRDREAEAWARELARDSG
jgi:hypothetical protein